MIVDTFDSKLAYWDSDIYSMKSDEGAAEIKEVMKWVLGWIILQRLGRRFKFMVRIYNCHAPWILTNR
jgi:hypothetical protein